LRDIEQQCTGQAVSSVNGAEHLGKGFGKLLQTRKKDGNKWGKI